MKEQLHNPSADKLSPNQRYKNALAETESYCASIKADHRFVGGTIADLLSPTTRISLDIEKHIISLRNYPPLTPFRSDGSSKDVDTIFFTKSFEVFQIARKDFAFRQKTAKHDNILPPAISIEAARHPHWSPRNNIKQFVTAWEIDLDNKPSLNFGSIHQPIHPWTIKPWTYQLEDDQMKFTGLNPFGFALCYALRVPSGVKMKEKNINQYTQVNYNDNRPITRYSKISLIMRFAAQAYREAQCHGINLRDLHEEWISYIHNLQHTTDPLIRLKAAGTKWYWENLGDASNGKGPLGFLSGFNDKMSG